MNSIKSAIFHHTKTRGQRYKVFLCPHLRK